MASCFIQLNAQIPRMLSYQGILSDTVGTPKPNGTYAITFRLYTQAGGGSPIWSETKTLQVRRGLFSTILGDFTAFADSVRFNRQYWLGIQVAPDPELLPRIKLAAAGYSINSARADTAQYALSAPGGSGVADSARIAGTVATPLSLSSSVALGTTLTASNTTPLGRGIEGIGGIIGVYGNSTSFSGKGVYGSNSNPNIGFGVYGVSVGTDVGSAGVLGEANGGTNGSGVYGTSPSGVGVYGVSSNNDGVVGASSTANKSGVWGHNDVGSGVGVAGSSTNGFGVKGVSQNLTGVHGEATGTSGVNFGVFGRTLSPDGFAGYFQGKVAVSVLQILGGSDVAEPFESEEGMMLEPGTVMAIDPDHPGKLKGSEEAYDHKVAGIVSGAGGVKPGLTLKQEGVVEGKMLVAIAGRVYCKAEAISSPIEAGDLLTTSSMAGHAMKATDRDKSHGTIIGKAMSRLKDGKGLVLVLVNLQ